MRVTMHCGKRGTLQHNDHDANVKNAEWDKTKTKDNFIWTCVKDCNNVADAELYSYNQLYGKTLEEQNKRHIERRQTARVRNMSQWMKTSQNKSCETILQLGDKDNHADEDTLWDCAVEFVNWKQKRFKGVYSALSMSLHVDESTPHIHLRETWYYHDKDGNPHPGIKAALKEKGIPLPDLTKPEGKDNYRKAVADAECREKWQSICRSHGLQIETEPLPRRQHMSKDAYKEYKQSVESLQAEREALETKMDEMISNYEERVQNAVRNVLARTRKDLSEQERREAVARAYDSMNIKEMTSQSDDVEYE